MSSLRASSPGSDEIGDDYRAEERGERAVGLSERLADRLYLAGVVGIDHRSNEVTCHPLHCAAADVPAGDQRLSQLFGPGDGLWCERQGAT